MLNCSFDLPCILKLSPNVFEATISYIMPLILITNELNFTPHLLQLEARNSVTYDHIATFFLPLSLFIQFFLRSRIFHRQRIEQFLRIYILQLESGDSVTYVHILIYVLPYDCSFNSIHGQRVMSPVFFQNNHDNICCFLFNSPNQFACIDFLA